VAPNRTVTPGISNYTNNPEQAGISLQSLVEYAKEYVPEDQWAKTPIYLKATGGMRLLNLTQQEPILDSIRNFLSNTSFLFPNPLYYAKTISGEEEGVFGWIAVNFLTNIIFTLYNNTGTITDCVGALDLGGASTQITFVPSAFTQPNKTYTLQMAGINYDLYTHSFLGNGISEAIKAVICFACQKSNNQTTISFPCYHDGFFSDFTCNDIVYNITGTTNTSYDSCYNLIVESQIINTSNCAGMPECSFNDTYQPSIRGNFYAFSTFADVWEFFKISPVNNLTVLYEILLGHCVKNWSIVQQENNSTNSSPEWYCFDGVYIINLLNKGFGFSMNQSITVTNKIRSHDVTWALGAMIFEASLVPNLPRVTNWVLIVSMILLSIALVGVGIIIFVRRNFKRDENELRKSLTSEGYKN